MVFNRGFAIAAPHLTGIGLKLFVKLLETPLIGSLIISHLKKENKMLEASVFFLLLTSRFFFLNSENKVAT